MRLFWAGYYDELTRNVDYGKQADYLEVCAIGWDMLRLILDLACGTGSLTVEAVQAGCGYLWCRWIAGNALSGHAEGLRRRTAYFISMSKMQRIDLYGTVDTVVCTWTALTI